MQPSPSVASCPQDAGENRSFQVCFTRRLRSAQGGRRAAIIYSIVCTCSLLGIEPWAYLKDALQQLAEGADPATLRPRLWSAARVTL